jgi:hypothetical protein
VHQLAQVAEAVDRFTQWGELEHTLAVALFHVAVVLEERDIVGGGLDARDDAGARRKSLRLAGPMWWRMRVPWMRVEKSLPTSPW